MILRPYQIDTLDVLHDAIQDRDILLLQAATGAGKTAMIVRMIQRYFNSDSSRTFLIVMHKQELIQQFMASFKKFTSIPVADIGIACKGLSSKVVTDRRITIASVQTLVNQLNVYGGADLVVVDETHRIGHDDNSQYKVLLNKLREYKPDHKVIGVTATAYRLGHGMIYGDECKAGRDNFFPDLTHRVLYSDLVRDGYLMPLKGFVACDGDTAEELSNATMTSGEYNMLDAGRIMTRHISSAVDAFEKYGADHKSVAVFACTIDHATRLSEEFSSRGHSACVIHSKLSAIERDYNLKEWQSGRIKIAVSINVLVEGFDHPGLSCLVMCRPTKSPVVFVQAIGRVLRVHEEKSESLLIDLTSNVMEFGLDLDNPRFTIPSGMDGKGEAPVKICPGNNEDGTACGMSLHPATMVCHYCGYEYPVVEMEASVSKMKEVNFNGEEEPPEWYDVMGMSTSIHTSKEGKQLLKVSLQVGSGFYGSKSVNVWICLRDYYKGFAVDKGEEKWNEFSEEPFPDNVEEAEFLSGTFKVPSRALCSKKDRFLELIELDFNLIECNDNKQEEFDNVPF